MDTDKRYPIKRMKHWIELKIRFALPQIWWGGLWAALCGSIAAGHLGWDERTLVRLLLVLILADPLIANLCRLLFDFDWTNEYLKGQPIASEAQTGYVSILPYTQSVSPGGRIGHWLKKIGKSWTEVLWPHLGWMISTVIFEIVCILALGFILGEPVIWLVILSLGLIGLSLIIRSRLPKVTIGLRAIIEVGFPWLIGYWSFAPLYPAAVISAALYALIYATSLWLLTRGIGKSTWLIPISLVGLVIIAILVGQPVPATLLALTSIFPIWSTYIAIKTEVTAQGYIFMLNPYLLGATFISALSLGLA